MKEIYLDVMKKKLGLYILPVFAYFPGLLFTAFWGLAIASSFPNASFWGYILVVLPESILLTVVHLPFNKAVIAEYNKVYGEKASNRMLLNTISFVQSVLAVGVLFTIVRF